MLSFILTVNQRRINVIPEILYEDNHIIVAVKPQNLPVQADDSGDNDMLTILKAYIKEKYNKPGNVYLGLVHRLDRPVGGVMVFARTSKAAARLTDYFKKTAVHKKYAAVVCGNAPFSKQLECYMKKDEKTFSSYICNKNTDGAKFAQLSYERLAQNSNVALLDVTLKTGRHHQIRLQLSNDGLPIYGDHRYNPQFINDSTTNIALFAYSLTVEHPITHEIMRFSAIPSGGVWNSFSEYLKCLKEAVTPIYIDQNIVVCDKQKGQSVARADGDINNLEDKLSLALGEIYAVHRLDATTDGLVIFARNQKSFDALSDAFADKQSGCISKYYRCTVIGAPKKSSARLVAYLVKDENKGLVSIYNNETAHSKQIITEYTVINKRTVNSVVLSDLEVKLITGRTHQIRAHLAHIGCPILGDDKYGNREINKQLKCKTVSLRACRIVFNFPGNTFLSYLNGIEFGE